MKMKNSLFLIFTILLITLFISQNPFFYGVNYYDKNGIYKQEIKFGFKKINFDKINSEIYTIKIEKDQVNIYKNYDLIVKIDDRAFKLKTNFSENVKDVLRRVGIDKSKDFVILSSDNRKVRFSRFASSFLLSGCKFYTLKNFTFIFNRKTYKASYYGFYSDKEVKKIVMNKLWPELKKLGINSVKSIEFVDLEQGFIPVSNSPVYRNVGVNIGFIKSYEVEIPYKTKVVYTMDLRQGQKRIIRKGRNGRILKNYVVHIDFDGEKTSELLSKKMLERSVDEVIEIGIAPLYQLDGKSYYIMESTGYTAGIGGVGYYTYTGERVRRGIVAVDPNVIPLGTKIYVEGYGYAVASDKGSAIKGFKIDLYFETYDEAIMWGRRKVKVYLLK
ncbi:MAG: 3D domain-containing protein [Candidatus Calescibacterium sp.]|nr:3D domain-containing protein [Candidatus Calescibacterium sp.]MDW8132472.1 3D domain-containing protein [Candidatus Calescibacterium sp.]